MSEPKGSGGLPGPASKIVEPIPDTDRIIIRENGFFVRVKAEAVHEALSHIKAEGEGGNHA